jgi:hypothetical protein
MIPPMCPATIKRDLIQAALMGKGHAVTNNGAGGNSLTVTDVPRFAEVWLNTGGTGEIGDSISISRPPVGYVAFVDVFSPLDNQGRPAIFTAGIITDVGELTAQVSSEELNFQTDGPIICQALFQRLAPHAPDYGAQINFAGDRLEVYFDPAYSISVGGITFGTTSQSQQGATGALQTPDQAPAPRCDMDGNGLVEIPDIFKYLSRWFAHDPIADWDADGDEDVPDIFSYLRDWFAGR